MSFFILLGTSLQCQHHRFKVHDIRSIVSFCSSTASNYRYQQNGHWNRKYLYFGIVLPVTNCTRGALKWRLALFLVLWVLNQAIPCLFLGHGLVYWQVIPENTERPILGYRVVVPTNADTQPFARGCVVARHSEWPADLQGAARVATNSPTPQPVSTKVKCTVKCVSCWCSRHLERSHLAWRVGKAIM